jgi:hypothetical protein
MKKRNSVTKPSVASATKRPVADWLTTDPRYTGLPTPGELAMIAATLASNIKQEKYWALTHEEKSDWADELAFAALNLWITSRKVVVCSLENSSIKKADEEMHKELFPYDKTPFPGDRWEGIERPVSRDLFLRTMLPRYKNRTADLARIGKAYLRDRLREKNGKVLTQDEVADAYGKWKDVGKYWENANEWAEHFQKWFPRYVAEVRRTAGLKSAAIKSKTRAAIP